MYNRLLESLKNQDKEASLNICMEALDQGQIGVVDLYENVLRPALNNIIEEYEDDEELIWKEHVRSGIIRTIIENSYPYVMKARKRLNRRINKGVIVLCPRFEDHEIGARMANDFFTIAGYNATFIGGNTPEETILQAIEHTRPRYISMSITNYYNLIAAKDTIELIKRESPYTMKFLLGGYAFTKDNNYHKDIGGDLLLKSFKDILELEGVILG